MRARKSIAASVFSVERFPNYVAQHGLLRGRKRDEQPHVTERIGIALLYVALFLCDEIPLFVQLDQVHLQIAHEPVVQTCATIAYTQAEGHDRVAVDVG